MTSPRGHEPNDGFIVQNPELLEAAIRTAFSGDDVARAAQTAEMPGAPGLTMRDFANALVVGSFRNGFVEELHAGEHSPLLEDRRFSRITDPEMKKLCLEMSARLAHLLHIYLRTPSVFAEYMSTWLLRYAKDWDREALTFELPAPLVETSVCSACRSAIASSWAFCPSCDAQVPPIRAERAA